MNIDQFPVSQKIGACYILQ